MAKDIEESCPCCRHVANQHERLPDIDVESESSASEYLADQQENARNLAQHIANERAQTKFETLRSSLSKDEFEAYAATRINAVVRGYWWRKSWLEHAARAQDLEAIRRRIRRVTADLVKTSNTLNFNLPSVTMSRREWLNRVATKIQAVARGWMIRNKLSTKETIRISWGIVNGVWARTIRFGLWDGVGLEPQALAFKMHCCAKKIQGAWRSYRAILS